CRPSGVRTGTFANRWTRSSSARSPRNTPTITRPLSAPRSTAANAVSRVIHVAPVKAASDAILCAGLPQLVLLFLTGQGRKDQNEGHHPELEQVRQTKVHPGSDLTNLIPDP